MTTAAWSRFFALLALLCAAATIATWLAVWVVRRRRHPGRVAEFDATLRDLALWLAAIVAVVTTAGSLYYSLGAHYVPCELCWYQRICIYPLAVILPIAAWRRDIAVRWYALPLVAVGAVIAAYHTQLQAFPDQRTFCDPNNPCSSRYVWEFGFVSLPLMDLVAFAFIATMLAVARPADEPTTSPTSPSTLGSTLAPTMPGAS